MGACFSKTKCSAPSPSYLNKPSVQNESEDLQRKHTLVVHGEEGEKGEERVTKEEKTSVIEHRKSHDDGNSPVSNNSETGEIGDSVPLSAVRTSNCTKEEVDAILIRCGQLSRNSSGKASGSTRLTGSSIKYSGSKRSYDFDNSSEVDNFDNNSKVDGGDENRQCQWQRDQRRSRSSSHGRRRTPSRETERQQRSGSRDGASSSTGTGGGRRVSRSPGRRSKKAFTIPAEKSTAQAPLNSSSIRPGNMVSVPASVSSFPMDKSDHGGGIHSQGLNGNAVTRKVPLRRKAGASPRSQSPAKPSPYSNLNQQQQPSLSRSSSRKTEHSPYRRNPLTEIDNNPVVATKNSKTRDTKEVKPNFSDEAKGTNPKANYVETATIPSGAKIPKPQALTRSRSSRRSQSRDLDFNPASSYNSLLLEDIQNFHQRNNPATATESSLPPCLTKACSIVEAVEDLNSSCTASNLSSVYSDDNAGGKRRLESKGPILESVMVTVEDDLMEPSFHKYVTINRGTASREEMEEVESSGSNSFVSCAQRHHYWVSPPPSSWEPTSADSTDCWTNSRSNDIKEDLCGKNCRIGHTSAGRDLPPVRAIAAAGST